MSKQRPIGEQMAVLNAADDGSFTADQSSSIMNATCPGRIQNTSDPKNPSLNESMSSRKWVRPKREPVKISPLVPIDEMLPSKRRYSASKERNSDYKTRLCEAFRREGYCSYNEKCTYAHGHNELRFPKRRVPEYYRGREIRESRDNNRSRREDADSSYSKSSSRNRDREESRRYQSSSGSSHQRSICHNFERGNCRYGPRCRYLHIEQMKHFNPNATMYAPPSSFESQPSMVYYSNHHHHQAQFVPIMPYFIAPQTSSQPQYATAASDGNQIYTTMTPMPPGATGAPMYFYQPPSALIAAPSQGEMIEGQMIDAVPDGFFAQPPPQLMS